jgi:hypothetical protein
VTYEQPTAAHNKKGGRAALNASQFTSMLRLTRVPEGAATSHPVVSPGRLQAVDLPVGPLEISMTNARTIHRDFFIDYAIHAGKWRVVAITHSLTGQALLPPTFNYPDLETAERYAKAAIDGQLSKHGH